MKHDSILTELKEFAEVIELHCQRYKKFADAASLLGFSSLTSEFDFTQKDLGNLQKRMLGIIEEIEGIDQEVQLPAIQE